MVTYSDSEWWERGACRDGNPAIFEPNDLRATWRESDRRRRPRRDWSAAKALCSSCTVQPECLKFTLEHPPPLGKDELFAAGYTPEQLGQIRREWAKKRRKQ